MLEFRAEFDNADLVYLIVDNRLPEEVDFWPAFQPWWASRIMHTGPNPESTALVWFPLDTHGGLQYVPHIWAGVFALLVARFLFPPIHIALIGTDCVPVSLFEVPDLIVLAQLQMSAHSVHTSPGCLPNILQSSCRALSYFRPIRLTLNSCGLQCFTVLDVINQLPRLFFSR